MKIEFNGNGTVTVNNNYLHEIKDFFQFCRDMDLQKKQSNKMYNTEKKRKILEELNKHVNKTSTEFNEAWNKLKD